MGLEPTIEKKKKIGFGGVRRSNQKGVVCAGLTACAPQCSLRYADDVLFNICYIQ